MVAELGLCQRSRRDRSTGGPMELSDDEGRLSSKPYDVKPGAAELAGAFRDGSRPLLLYHSRLVCWF